MKLGLMGGTFDPIHLGHLRAAENARTALSLDTVLLMPAATPPHRRAPAAAPWHRYAMVALAAAGCPGLVASPLELEREGPSYTVDTVRALSSRRPDGEVTVILGGDAFAEVASWREWEWLRGQVAFAVVGRPGQPPPPVLAERQSVVPSSELLISSSDLRARLSRGESVRHLVPPAVAEYIGKAELYR